MNKSIFLTPFAFRGSDRQSFWAAAIGAGVGLAAFGYLGDRLSQNHGGFTYVIVVAFLILGHFVGQLLGAAVYNFSTRNTGSRASSILCGLAPLEWVVVVAAVLAFCCGVWLLVYSFIYSNVEMIPVATLLFGSSSAPLASWRKSVWAAAFNFTLVAADVFLCIKLQSGIPLVAAFFCLLFGGLALVPKRPRH